MSESWRRPRVLIAWSLFGACSVLVLYLGSNEFSASITQGILGPILEWLFPGMDALDRWQLHHNLRTSAHSLEYGVLALLAFRAVFVSFDTLLARLIALSLLLVLAVAATDEVRQAFAANRTGSIRDVGLDLFGATIALGLIALVRHRRTRRRETGTETT